MEKYARFVPMALFFAYVAKSLLISTSLADAGIVFSLAAVAVFFEYRIKDQKLAEINQKLDKQAQEFEELKGKMRATEGNMAGLKLGLGARTITNAKI